MFKKCTPLGVPTLKKINPQFCQTLATKGNKFKKICPLSLLHRPFPVPSLPKIKATNFFYNIFLSLFCIDRWSREYNRLVYRFRNTIIGQFFGHTHFDEFELFFAPPELATEVVSIAYLAPSQTPHDGLNPAYRVYNIDGKCQVGK